MHRRTQWLIERATRAMLYWLEESERLSARYDQRMAEEASRSVGELGREAIHGKIAFAGTVECKDLLSNGVWAHRKVCSYAAVAQALSARAIALGDSESDLTVALSGANTHRGVFDIDATPGSRLRKTIRPWAWGTRRAHTP